ncbi:MAG: tRNA (adenosine(37)-N6)-threonylcarbamoyltransferase complex dimerization subunit type 1 TsaB [Candidatus Alcyoniella australis]|nr:tRNA (adenosine(37)-N6)-threonylcarbamoyltransferase complex dimerization subunit type 1 TsaB [Candidatus Alcyoniella australis]
MYLLAVESATSAGGAALFCEQELICSRQWNQRGNQTALLLPAIIELLAESGISFDRLDKVACGVGPGRFTSLRVAVATAQGIALARGIQALAVSTLEALAQPLIDRGVPVLACVDAGRGQLYAGLYRADERGLPLPLIEDAAFDAEKLADILPDELIVAGDAGPYFDELCGGRKCMRAPDELCYPSAVAVGRIALGRPERAEGPARLQPRYLRRSAAEINLD